MRVKYIKESSFGYDLVVGKIYSVVSVWAPYNHTLKKKELRFMCVDRSCFDNSYYCFDTSYKSDFFYTFRFHHISKEHFEVLSDLIPLDWEVDVGENSVSIEPKIFEEYWEYFYDDVPEPLRVFKKECLKIIAFDSGKDMKGFFAEDLLTHIAEQGYNAEELSKWAKKYRLDFLEEMYDQEVHSDISKMIDDLSLYDWNPDLAIPEKELMEKLMKWSEEGTVERPPSLSFQDILKTYKDR